LGALERLHGPGVVDVHERVELARALAANQWLWRSGLGPVDDADRAREHLEPGVMFGDDDLMTMEHVNATYEGIPDAELAIVPGTSHVVLQEKPALCNEIIVQFLTEDAVPTVAPIRRAG